MGQAVSSNASSVVLIRCTSQAMHEKKEIHFVEEICDASPRVQFKAAYCRNKDSVLLSTTGEIFVWKRYGNARRSEAFDYDYADAILLWGCRGFEYKPVSKHITAKTASSSNLTIVKFPVNYPVQQIACGLEHTLALLTDGSVYSWGQGSCGRLGHGNEFSCSKPTLLSALNPYTIENIAAGEFHSACLSKVPESWVFTWGLGTSGQLQLDLTNRSNQLVPTVVSELLSRNAHWLISEEYVKEVKCGGNLTACLTNKGRVLTWGGSCEPGVVVFESSSSFLHQNDGVSEVVIDFDLGAKYGVALTIKGEIFVWGNFHMDDSASFVDYEHKKVEMSMRSFTSMEAKSVPKLNTSQQQDSTINEDKILNIGRVKAKEIKVPKFHNELIMKVFSGGHKISCLTTSSAILLVAPYRNLAPITHGLSNSNCNNASIIFHNILLSSLYDWNDALSVLRIPFITGIGDVAMGYDRFLVVLNTETYLHQIITHITTRQDYLAWRYALDASSLSSPSERQDYLPWKYAVDSSSSSSLLLDQSHNNKDIYLDNTQETSTPGESIGVDICYPLLSLLFPTLKLHPQLRSRLLFLSLHMAQLVKRSELILRVLKDVSGNTITPTALVTDTDNGNQDLVLHRRSQIHKTLHDIVKNFTTSETYENSDADCHHTVSSNINNSLISVISGELRTHQDLITVLLSSLIYSDQLTRKTKRENERLQLEMDKYLEKICSLEQKLEITYQQNKVQLFELEKKFKERELRWKNSVQHLRKRFNQKRDNDDQ